MIRSRLQFFFFLVLVALIVVLSSGCDYPHKFFAYGDSVTQGCVPCMTTPAAPECEPCQSETGDYRLDCDNFSYPMALQRKLNQLPTSDPYYCSNTTLDGCVIKHGVGGIWVMNSKDDFLAALDGLVPANYPNLHTILYLIGGNDVLASFADAACCLWPFCTGCRISAPWNMDVPEFDRAYIRSQIVGVEQDPRFTPSVWNLRLGAEEILARNYVLVLGTYAMVPPGAMYPDAAQAALLSKFVKVFNQEVRNLKAQLDVSYPGRVKLADLNDTYLGDDGSPYYDWTDFYRIDGIHPNITGYEVAADLWYNTILGL